MSKEKWSGITKIEGLKEKLMGRCDHRYTRKFITIDSGLVIASCSNCEQELYEFKLPKKQKPKIRKTSCSPYTFILKF